MGNVASQTDYSGKMCIRDRGSAPADTLELGTFSFDFERLRFMRNGTEVELSKTEQRLLRLLVEHRGQTLTREQLLDRVWDGGEFVDANALSVAVKRLRDKLTDAPIKTVYGLCLLYTSSPSP